MSERVNRSRFFHSSAAPLYLAVFLGTVFGGPVLAAGNAANGKVLAQTCLGCHGVPGYDNVYPTYHVPKLGGQSADYLVSAISEYQSGQRDHDTMCANVQGLTPQDMADIAAFFASVTAAE